MGRNPREAISLRPVEVQVGAAKIGPGAWDMARQMPRLSREEDVAPRHGLVPVEQRPKQREALETLTGMKTVWTRREIPTGNGNGNNGGGQQIW